MAAPSLIQAIGMHACSPIARTSRSINKIFCTPRQTPHSNAAAHDIASHLQALMESHAAAAAAAAAAAPSRPAGLQPLPAAQAAAAAQYFANRAAAPGLVRTDREHLSDLEHKLTQARQRFQDLKEEKCNAASKSCGCGCCSHGYARAHDQKATSIGQDARSVSETSTQPAKKAAGGRQHLTRSSVKSLSSQDTTTMGAEQGSAEGLLLAVDKFLSMK